MLSAKIKYRLRNTFDFLKKFHIPQVRIPTQVLVLLVITSFLSITLVQNIYASLNDLENYKIIEREQAELDRLENENAKLKEQVEYYASPKYVKLYGRETMNYVEAGQKIFVVERNRDYDYENEKVQMEEIDFDNHRKWWLEMII